MWRFFSRHFRMEKFFAEQYAKKALPPKRLAARRRIHEEFKKALTA